MDIHIHAQLMAHHCVPRIADLVMRVPLDKPGDDNFQTRLIGSLVHGCQMSRNCRYADAVEAMFVVTEHLFATAQRSNFDAHNNAHMQIVSMVSHASQMGTTTPEGVAEMLTAVQPMVDAALPSTQCELDDLHARLELARQKIGRISHRILMERSRENFARAMQRR